jgi:hypothetical protein
MPERPGGTATQERTTTVIETRGSYLPGVRGWWQFLRLADALRDGDGIQWSALASRARPSARLRQCETERLYWVIELAALQERAGRNGLG